MLQNNSTTIVSEVKDFFTSGEKAIYTVLTILSSLTFSEKHLGIESKCNNKHENFNKLLLVVMFPFFEVKDAWHYGQSTLYPAFRCGKDVFYRLMNDFSIPWRKVSYKLTMQPIDKTAAKSTGKNDEQPRCLIVDDTDLPKTGWRMELIGKVFSHVTQKSVLAFKGLFMGYHDGKSFFAMDFSLHCEEGKNKKRPYGLSTKQLKARYSKHRDKSSSGSKRKQEYFTTKINNIRPPIPIFENQMNSDSYS